MASYSTNEFKSGLKVLLEGDPCAILENEFVKPGKGQAFNRVKFRNLKTGRVWERTFKSGESIEAADVMEFDMEYLYTDGEFWHFMKTDGSFEQIGAPEAAVAGVKDWLKEQDADFICIQDLRCSEYDLQDSVFFPEDYNAYFFDDIDGKSNGVAIYCRRLPIQLPTAPYLDRHR